MPDLCASTRIRLARPLAVLDDLCCTFAEFGSVERHGRTCTIVTDFGRAELGAGDIALTIEASGADDTALAYVKLSFAEHILRIARAEAPCIDWRGDGAAGSPLPYFREMHVVSACQITPRMRRIVLGGTDLARFACGGLHVRLLFPRERDKPTAWPVTGGDGRPHWPRDGERPDVRIYTIRRIDVEAGEVTIDMLLHDGNRTPGAGFAATARPGDMVGMTGPGGGRVGDARLLLLAGDQTALPAIARILETLPQTAKATVRIEVSDAAEEQALASKAEIDLGWIHRSRSNACGRDALVDAVRDVRWPADASDLFAWAGCEHRSFRALRAYFRDERGLPHEQHLAAAYWRRGRSGNETR